MTSIPLFAAGSISKTVLKSPFMSSHTSISRYYTIRNPQIAQITQSEILILHSIDNGLTFMTGKKVSALATKTVSINGKRDYKALFFLTQRQSIRLNSDAEKDIEGANKKKTIFFKYFHSLCLRASVVYYGSTLSDD